MFCSVLSVLFCCVLLSCIRFSLFWFRSSSILPPALFVLLVKSLRSF